MAKKLITCKACGGELAANAKSCPHCGAKNKKPFYKKLWFWLIVAVVLIAMVSGGGEEPAQQIGTVPTQPTESTNINAPDNTPNNTPTNAPTDAPTTPPAKKVYNVGDILLDGDMKIVYVASGVYKEENQYSQPQSGYKYIFLRFAFENTSTKHDASVSSYSFECYADGYAAQMYYAGDEGLSATLSAGRVTTGCVYFTVPENAKQIEIEYETNWFTEKKIKFVYEGEKDTGYVPAGTATATPGAYGVGGTAESSNLKIVYLSCTEYVSDNMFIQPKEGYRFVSCEFEFENLGKSDEFISSWDFDCYADGFSCEGTFIRDDDLSATLSVGRKTKGTVTFEVPVDAKVIEVEYLSNYWTSKRVVFTVK